MVMKKYKLIKKYPNSPKLGAIYDRSAFIGDFGFESDFSKYPEFWEKVIEKDYEILELSLLRSDKHQITDMRHCGDEYILSLLACNGNKIHSIKRLSDGEVFTIGDKIKGYNSDNGFIITDIWLSNDNVKEVLCIANYPKNQSILGNRSCYLNNDFPQKVKHPLFTTKDGVDIFNKNDKVWYIDPSFKMDLGNTTADIAEASTSDFIFFATKEKAEEWILMNKPVLSYKDVLDHIYINNVNEKNIIELKEFVKSKL